MSNMRFNQFVASREHKTVILDGYVQLAVGGAVVAENMLGASVARTGTGIYKVTLENEVGGKATSFPRVLSAQVQLVTATNQALFCQIEQFLSNGVHSITNVDSFTFKIVNSSGVPTDVGLVCGVVINAVFSNTSVTS